MVGHSAHATCSCSVLDLYLLEKFMHIQAFITFCFMLFSSILKRKRETGSPNPLGHSPNDHSSGDGAVLKPGSQSSIWACHLGVPDLSASAITTASQYSLAGSWFGGQVVGTGTRLFDEICRHPKRWLSLLCHSAPSITFLTECRF